MRRLLAVGLVVVLLVGTVPTAAVLGGTPAHEATASPQTPAWSPHVVGDGASPNVVTGAPQTLGVAENFDSVEFHITVYENGTAGWTFTYQRTLNNETERQQFERFADEFNNNSTAMWSEFRQQARRLAGAGQNTTGRTMKAQNFGKRAYVGGLVNDNRGIVKMSFQWTGFTYSQGETIIIGDVFEGGLYIGPNQSLVVHSGPGLQFESADPMKSAKASGDTLAASESVTWQGERDFIDQRPRVKFDPVAGTTTTTTTTTGTGASGGDNATETTPNGATGPSSGDDWSPLMMFIGAVVVLLGLAAAFAWRQGDFGSFASDTDNPGDDDGSSGGGAAAANNESTPNEPSVSDEELLTDEARVKKLLDENGGRMKQVNIVDETGWSKSKVSMLLSEMEEDGEISKLRVGRENIISLEGHEPDAAGSPLEE
ncbi:helix-turn-helix transcriptional regulator [Halorussus lipolyticus]|uniref:helix-turn-helix transcriptional regulator n=1 Tax=Halorussus lipolyticus TaxID=3034024 RepID=UPI0023E8ED4A|nr:hypothetical protein [Halorussus sp. DT80]